jgi:serine phosphatase RsbU (regulator of sigma subunit)
MIQAQMNYDFNRKTDSTKAAQDQLNLIEAKERQHEKVLLNSFIGGFAIMLVLALFIFRGYRQKQKAYKIITRQKELVEGKNKEILDSITYAKRLQEAILPPIGLIKKALPESFVLYRPKDIVAGDFYWIERSGDSLFIAAADCTGHGVPGALVSVICSNALNRTVKEFHIKESGKILDKVTELVLETFEKSESVVQDGMDISLCCINMLTKEVQWSGAYNPLWYIENGKMHETPADKQPVGKMENSQPFNTYNIKLQKGDTLYMFTDGYADQFGGPRGKKFKYQQLEELLLANASRPMEEQKTILEGYLDEWKGQLDQVDDILVMGIRI